MSDIVKQSRRDFGAGYTHLGEDANGQDLKVYGDTTGKYFFWDASANKFKIVGDLEVDGSLALDDIVLADNETLTFGTGLDVVMSWDGTNLIVAAAADDSLIEIGDSGTTQKSFDLKWYGNGNSGVDYLYFDASANLIYTTGIDLQFKDNDILVFGTGAGATGDVNIKWDATNLVMSSVAASSAWNIGAAGNVINTTQHGTLTVGVNDTGYDVNFYGATSGKKFFWDESADTAFLTCTVDIDGTVTVGVDDTGYDVKFFGATAGKYMYWEEAEDKLTIAGAFLVSGNSQFTGTVTVGVNDTGHDVKFFGATAGKYMLWDESDDKLIIAGGYDITGNSQLTGTLTVGVNDIGHDVKFFGATAGKYFLWDESADSAIVLGNVGIGVSSVQAWDTNFSAIEFERSSIMSGITDTGISLFSNAYKTDYVRYKSDNLAGQLVLFNGELYWRTAATGTTGNVITFIEKLKGDKDGNFLLGGAAVETSSAGALSIKQGTNPTTNGADQITVYATSGANATLGLCTEVAVAAEEDETKFSHKLAVKINGADYFIMLTQT
jgi:hypothetical protein